MKEQVGMIVTTCIALLAAFALSLAFPGDALGGEAAPDDKPAIVLVAFGSSVAEARKAFDNIEKVVRQRFPGHKVYWAFTAKSIVKKLKKQGIDINTFEDTLKRLHKDGVKKAVLQSIHTVPGQKDAEFREVKIEGMEIAYGAPLLATDEDVKSVADALVKLYDPKAANVLAAHGNDRHPEYNEKILALAKAVEAGRDNVFVLSVEGKPGLEKLDAARAKAKETGAVHFIPFMIVAGDHVMNDVMGDEEESWKVLFGAKKTTCAKPLGFQQPILDVYMDHLAEALKTLEKK